MTQAKAMLAGTAAEYPAHDTGERRWYRPMELDEALALPAGATVHYLWEGFIYVSTFIEHKENAMRCYFRMHRNVFHCPHGIVHLHMKVPL